MGIIGIPLLNTQYRLSRVHAAGHDYQTYNRVILYSPYGDQANAKFVEGFGANEFLIEANTGSYQFRKQTTVPVELQEIDKFKVVGDYRGLGPDIRSWLSFTIVPWGLDVSERQEVFNCRVRDLDASHGLEIDAYNSTELGTNTDINFYDRDVRTIGGQRNMLTARKKIVPTPPPETITEQILERL
ncbi:MAG: hypothetical protein DRJ03_01260 [Chloroflexi bacterium]|nr:MAG: hypothetical protein DRJ03_01260 [Chloroflexota bacterium]